MTARDCEACTVCLDCDRSWCREERPSPGEPYVCDDCWMKREEVAVA